AGLNIRMQGGWKVGLLVVAFVALLFSGYAILGKSLLAPKTNRFYADFTDAAGITAGAPVFMAGVKIGTVNSVSLSSPTLAQFAIEVDGTVHIPAGSTANIQSPLI